MSNSPFLDRARRSLRLVREHQHLRDVAEEVSAIRECLAASGTSPVSLGVTDADLVEMVRNGYMAEARIIFELAVDKAASSIEKDFFFSELVALIVKAAVATAPAELPVRGPVLLVEPARDGVAVTEEPLSEIESLKASRERLAADLAATDARLAELRAAQDARNAATLAELDPLQGLQQLDRNGVTPFSGLEDGDIAVLNFDAFGETAPPPLPAMEENDDPVITITCEAIPIADEDDDGTPAIDLTEDDILTERIEVIVAPVPVDELFAIKFFGEKDAVALGLIHPLTNGRPPTAKRRVPPPLPPPRRDPPADVA
ncbi:MAG TPA: hypothetical protein VL500_07030 [Candidatus Eisenbacteria bacterium]|jgi:hypothetical protein|nr:hypothetical protein [Candidatus Eisenbacteria bacterium]